MSTRARHFRRLIRAEASSEAEKIVCDIAGEFSIEAAVPSGSAAALDKDQAASDPNARPKPPLPKFSLAAYNGGPMRIGGWRFPLVIKGEGVRSAAGQLPIHITHEHSTENLLGQTAAEGGCSIVQGCIRARGVVTGESQTVKNVLAHARNGFKFQASIEADPQTLHFLKAEDTETVNGVIRAGPLNVIDTCVLSGIAVVPLGADTSTSANIAASAAQEKHQMELYAWVLAEFGMDKATYDALADAAKAKIKAKFDAASASVAAGAKGGDAAGIKTGDRATADIKAQGAGGASDDGQADIKARRKAMADENRRIAAIDQIQAKYGTVKDVATICATAIENGDTADSVELVLLRASRAPSAAATIQAASEMPKDGLGGYASISARRGGRYEIERGPINDEQARVIEAAGLMSCGRNKQGQSWAEVLAKNPQYGERCVSTAEAVLRRYGTSIGPMGFLRLNAQLGGMTDLPHNNVEAYEQIIRGEFTTFALPVTLSNLTNKLMLDGFNSVDPNAGVAGGVAWQQVARRGPVNDFKPHYRVRMIGNQRPKKLGRGGEIQHGQLGEQSYKLQAEVRALMQGIAYQDIINDDLSAFQSIPTMAGVGCGEQIAEDVWTAYMSDLQSDGSTAFWSSSDHLTDTYIKQMAAIAANLITSKPFNFLNLGLAVQQFLLQTKPNGAPLGELPKLLVVPVGLVTDALQMHQSANLITNIISSNTTGTYKGTPGGNIFKGLYTPVCSQYLSNATITNYSASTWYLQSDPTSSVYPVEVGFLNGQEMPVIERDDMSFDRLGIGFRWWVSYGVGRGDPRSCVKATA
jgi:hypothetical protein